MAKKEGTKINKDLEERITVLEDQLKRAVADYHNLEKRVHADSSAIASFLRGELVIKLLPVIDSLDQAVAGVEQSEADSGWLKGVLMSIKHLRQVLAEEGLVEISTDGKFDPNLHEAIDVRGGENDKILEVAQRGYTLSGKILRPAKVVVGKSQPEKPSQEQQQVQEMDMEDQENG